METIGEFDRRTSEISTLRDANVRLQQQLRDAKDRTAQLVDSVYRGAKDAMVVLGPVESVVAPTSLGHPGTPETALWHLTDWQGGKLTTSYNSEVMRERVLNFVDKAIKITEIQRADHPVTELVILFGGDMLEGLFNFPTQPFEIDSTIFKQYVTVSRLMVDVVQRALAAYSLVTVVAEWGNHGRMGSKRDTVPRSDNLDRMIYELARQLLADNPRVIWGESSEDIQQVEIGNYRALLIHGDEVGRNGFASPMTIVQHVNRWKSGAWPWAFRDCYVGHYHTHNEWALADGEGSVFQTGSVESDNRYARETMASSAKPSQRLHFVNPEKGRVTATYKVWL